MNWILIVLALVAGQEPEVVYQSEPITHAKCLQGVDVVKALTSDDAIRFKGYCLPVEA